jgi:hypothetical protein
VTDIRWGSLVATVDGEIDRDKLKTTVAVGLALVGGLITAGAAVLELVAGAEVPHNALLITVGSQVLPLTGGTIASGLKK